MTSLEIEGKTIDEAIEKACDAFETTRDKLNIEIISEGTTGFLGIGNRKAKIKATLLSIAEALYESPPEPHAKGTSLFESSEKLTDSVPADGQEERDTAQEAKAILEGILVRMGLDCPVIVSETADTITLDIQGNGGGLLIGRRGQNLDALQYIVNKAIHKLNNGRKMIIVDTESYRQRREESLVALAAKIGAKVKKTKKAVTLNYLNAHNRRIIHMALQHDSALSTKSKGEGEFKKIIIIPVKKD